MAHATTEGIYICVETAYNQAHSKPSLHEHLFAYRVTIENQGTQAVKLISRHWNIFDSLQAGTRQVSGEGVVGNQPIILPNQQYSYVSGCSLKSDMGYMDGHYIMHRQNDNQVIKIQIPAFQLIADYKLN